MLTLFHECGHGLHHLLTQVDELAVSGIHGVEWDAVELPSQFMENFCWEWDVLQGMTAHVNTGEPLPRALYDKMIAAKNFQSGMQTVRQLEFSMFDLRLHGEVMQLGPVPIERVMALLDEVRREVAVMIPPAWHRFPHSFSHIFAGGYAAGYYSYKWAEALSADAFEAFEEAGAGKGSLLDPETGERFWREILAVGGSRPALDSFKAFRGREPRVRCAAAPQRDGGAPRHVKIATWNVNSLKVRLPHVLDWLAANKPDALACRNSSSRTRPSRSPSWKPPATTPSSSARRPTTASPSSARSRSTRPAWCATSPGFEDEQKRIIAATIDGVRVVCGDFPNGQAVGSDKFEYKLRWLAALTDWLRAELKTYERLVLAGDFNIAPEDRDAHPDWKDEIHVSEPERAAFRALQDLGLIDAFRLFEQPERAFSWWDYRMMAFRRNFGLRIDHLLVSPALREACRSCVVDKEPRRLERPSDHAPVVLDLALRPGAARARPDAPPYDNAAA